jgi:hypothetical protein
MHPLSCSRRKRRLVGVLLLLVSAACGEREGAGHPAFSPSDTAVASIDVATAEWIVEEYFRALVQGRTDDARNLLAPGPRSDASDQEMEQAAAALREVSVSGLEVVRMEAGRLVLRAELEVLPHPDHASAWRSGSNLRWVELVHDRRGWRIARITSKPVAAAAWWPVRSWSRLHILEAGISLDVPYGWVQREDGWAWSPPEHETQRVGVEWREGGVDADAEEPVPDGFRIVRTSPVELAWGSGTLYSLESTDPPASGSPSAVAEYVVISGSGGGVFSFHATAASAAELRQLRSVLRRMYAAAEVIPASSNPLTAGG